MTRVVIFHSARFGLVSYGNGEAYAVHDNENKRSMFVQGDEATDFRAEFDAWPEDIPTDDFCAEQLAIRGCEA